MSRLPQRKRKRPDRPTPFLLVSPRFGLCESEDVKRSPGYPSRGFCLSTRSIPASRARLTRRCGSQKSGRVKLSDVREEGRSPRYRGGLDPGGAALSEWIDGGEIANQDSETPMSRMEPRQPSDVSETLEIEVNSCAAFFCGLSESLSRSSSSCGSSACFISPIWSVPISAAPDLGSQTDET